MSIQKIGDFCNYSIDPFNPPRPGIHFEEMGPIKRKHKTLSLQEKHMILKKLNNGATHKQLAQMYGIGRSTITDIKKQRQRIESYLEKGYSPNRKTLKNAEFPKMEENLYSWILSQEIEEGALTFNVVAEKAKQLYEKHYDDNRFCASHGWIRNFKHRYGLTTLKIMGDEKTNSPHSSDPFKQKLKNKINELGLLPKQLYFATESPLFWKRLPENTNQKRLTLLLCSNSDGTHKLKVFVIGKAHEPKVKIPIEYKYASNAGVTSILFTDWFRNSFVQQVEQFSQEQGISSKAVLLIDMSFGQEFDKEITTNDGNIAVMMLPTNCATLMQPLDRIGIRLVKLSYKKALMRHVLTSTQEGAASSVINVNLLDAFCFLHEAWKKVPGDALKKYWAKVLDNNVWDLCPSLKMEPEEELTEIDSPDINQWLEEDQDPSLIEHEHNQVIIKEEYTIDEDESSSSTNIKHEDAVGYFNLCLEWAEQNNIQPNDKIVLKRLKEKALELVQTSLMRTKAVNFDQS